MEHKKILLIGGGGTLGTYTADELLRLGFSVDIICPEEKLSSNKALRFYREYATQEFLEKLGTRLVYLSDEFYINANKGIPDADAYEGFPQIENGVGLTASLREEFDAAIKLIPEGEYRRKVMLATGEIAYEFINGLAKRLEKAAPGIKINVYAIKNNFFGGGVTVSGLVTGGDIIEQLKDKPKADVLIIPQCMLRDGDNVFLDDTTLDEVSEALGIKVVPVLNDGYEFIEKITGTELEF